MSLQQTTQNDTYRSSEASFIRKHLSGVNNALAVIS